MCIFAAIFSCDFRQVPRLELIQQSGVRETGVSLHYGSPIKEPMKPLEHYDDMPSRGLMGPLIGLP